MFTLITGLFAMTFIIAVHEWGHLIAARMCGVPVDTFAIGMGPALFAVRDSQGTAWQLSVIPIGGFISPDQKAMEDASPATQIWIAAAGPIFSFGLSFVLLLGLAFIDMPQLQGQTVGFIERLTSSVGWAGLQTVDFVIRTIDMVRMLLTGEISVTNLSGPVGIVHTSGTQAALGWQPYVWLLAVLSTSIGVLNLLPFVPLDGGRIVTGFLRYVVGDTWAKRYMIIQGVPFVVMLLLLISTVTYHDIVRVFFQ